MIKYDTPRPFASVTVVGDFVFLSGMGGTDWKTGKVVGGIEEQTEYAFQKLIAGLEAAGTSLENVIKTTTYLARREDRDITSKISSKYWKGQGPPGTLVIAGLAQESMLFEIDAIAVRPDGAPAPKDVLKTPPLPKTSGK